MVTSYVRLDTEPKPEIDGDVTKGQTLVVTIEFENGTDVCIMTDDPEQMERIQFAAEVALREWSKLFGPEKV